jgi:aminopeptidase N
VRVRASGVGLAVVVTVGLLAGCGSDDEPDGPTSPAPSSAAPTSSAPPTGSPEPTDAPTDGPDLDEAVSEPVEDSLYPDVGEPDVDALHYDLDLTWDPDTDTLTGEQTLTFRATADLDDVQLDLAAPLEVSSLTLDGAEVDFDRAGKDLVVAAPVVADQEHVLEIAYAGAPEPVAGPTARDDISGVGFTVDADHQTWTVQEPFGAYTWYAVNDHPSDRAFYDLTLHVPAPWTGVAGGEQVLDETAGGVHTTAYHHADPIPAYLVALAFGDYERTDDTGPGGVPITYWHLRSTTLPETFARTPEAMAWLEERLGPYPFETAGIVVVNGQTGMETNTMITLGDDPYSTSVPVVVHELAHHWYGNQVSPSDWRDLWMNEGMAMYLQLLWEAEESGTDDDTYLRSYAGYEADYRAEAGPPGDFDPQQFASSNVYFSGAFLWHALRLRLDDDEVFWAAVRDWPASQDNTSTDRETLLAFLEDATGEDLDAFYDDWLLSPTTPPLD